MRLLLDTHAFIWWDSDPTKLSPHILEMCQNPDNELWLSVASVWEMQIKIQLGKLRLNWPLATVIAEQQQVNGLRILPIVLDHVLMLDQLPPHHKDPFDRLLAAQARVENTVLITADRIFAEYGIPVAW